MDFKSTLSDRYLYRCLSSKTWWCKKTFLSVFPTEWPSSMANIPAPHCGAMGIRKYIYYAYIFFLNVKLALKLIIALKGLKWSFRLRHGLKYYIWFFFFFLRSHWKTKRKNWIKKGTDKKRDFFTLPHSSFFYGVPKEFLHTYQTDRKISAFPSFKLLLFKKILFSSQQLQIYSFNVIFFLKYFLIIWENINNTVKAINTKIQLWNRGILNKMPIYSQFALRLVLQPIAAKHLDLDIRKFS